MNFRFILLVVCLWLFGVGCAEQTSQPIANVPPETRLAVDTVTTEQSSRLHISWYGDDSDGFVVGFVASFDKKHWFFTRKNDSLFSLKIENNDTSYYFSVASVDNSLKKYPVEGASVQFNDSNGNGYYDNGETFLGLEGAVDISPASTRFPIRNTPPVVFWGIDTSANSAKLVQLPDTTFTFATFQFGANDLDGSETIAYFEYTLNDSSSTAQWRKIPATQLYLTITADSGLIPNADNALYIRAVDIGELRSKNLRYPSAGKTWYVRKPKGTILLIKDNGSSDADKFYFSSMDNIEGGKFAGKYDVLDLRTGIKGRNVPPFINPMFIETLKLFRAVIWYGDSQASFTLAQEGLPEYIRSGGRVLFASELPNPISVDIQTALVDFAGVDSVSTLEVTTSPLDIKNGTEIIADSTSSGVRYSTLIKETSSVTPHSLYPKITSTSLFRLPLSTKWSGNPIVGVRNENRRMIFLNLPLHYLNKNQSAENFLRTVLIEEFGL
ncbi:MAG: hypothetical protein JST20_00450 [Bacteroidetes bacterium]|nr:hypothetical protein [Bacteroidota bacterium]